MTGALTRGSLRGTALLVGLAGYGLSMAMMVRSELGLDPWDVFHQGLAVHTGMTIGIASGVVGVAVLLAWIPLRNRPGIGTIANVIVIAITVDLGLLLMQAPTSTVIAMTMTLAIVPMPGRLRSGIQASNTAIPATADATPIVIPVC